VNQKRLDLMDDISDAHLAYTESGNKADQDALFDLIYDLVSHEEIADLERSKIEDRQRDFLDSWDLF